MTAYPHDDLSPVDPVEFVKEFQRTHGLTVDGIAGPQTWNAAQPSMWRVQPVNISSTISTADLERAIGNALRRRRRFGFGQA